VLGNLKLLLAPLIAGRLSFPDVRDEAFECDSFKRD